MNTLDINIKKLIEAAGNREYNNGTAYLNTVIPPREVAAAKAIYEPLEKTKEGQLKVLSDAKEGKPLAAYYLFNRYLGIIVNIYRQFLGWSDRQDKQIVEEYATRVLELLSGGRYIDEDGNIAISGPLKTWDPEKYVKMGANSNYLNYFAISYFRNYVKEEAKKMYRKQLRKGGTGTVDTYDDDLDKFNDDDPNAVMGDPSLNKAAPTIVSYDNFYTNDKEVAEDDFSDRVDTEVTLDAFEKWLKEHHGEKFNGVFQGIKKGTPVKQIAADLGISNPQMVRNYAEKIKQWAMDFYGQN